MINNSAIPNHQKITNSIQLEAETVGELFSKKVKEDPEKVFLICPGKQTDQFSYLEFEEVVNSCMILFHELKLKKNDKISLVFHNSSEFLILYFAGLSFGLTVVPINPDMSAREINYIVKDSNSKVIFLDEKLDEKIANNDFKDIIIKKIKSVSDLKLLTNKNKNVELNNITAYDPAVIIYTSGTTGNPKGAMLSHLNLISDALSISHRFEFDKDTRTLCILPLFHNNGQVTTLLSPLYTGGSTVIIKGKVSLYSFWDLVNEFNITWTSVMASILSILLSLPKERKDNTLIGILCGGQILTNSVQKK